MPRAQIGERCNIGQNVLVASDVKIGHNVKIQNNVSLYTGVVIEEEQLNMVPKEVKNVAGKVLRMTEIS